jgi:hypothetical protein
LTVGPILAGVAFALLGLPGIGGSYWTTYFPAISLLGLGMGITVAPLTASVMGAVPARFAGTASGVNNAVSRAGGLLAIAALGALLRERFDRVLDEQLAALALPASVQARVIGQRSKLVVADFGDVDAATAETLRHAFESAFVAGFRTSMIASGALAILAGVTAFVMIEKRADRPNERLS